MTASESIRLEPGQTAPDFTLTDEAGNSVSLSDYRGKRVVLYTYPKAFTPGCTTEACDFRDADARLVAAGYTVLALSADSVEKLAKFKQEYELPFTLLSDPDRAVQQAYGAYGEKNNYGRKVVGAIRSTFIIDENGTLIDARYNVKATGHVDRILKQLEAA
nr:thioredoxin-dependent thiol peroxidase [Pseudoclavibacter sp. Marseille-Q3772]